jgi:hypothetical protein
MSKTHQKSRAFCFTDFNCKKEFYEDWICEYLIIGEEICPNTGKLHWQGYIHFANARSVTAVRKDFQGIHVEPCKGSPQSNIKYCSKDNKVILEMGDRPEQGKRNDFEDCIEDIKKNPQVTIDELLVNHPSVGVRYTNGLARVLGAFQKQPKRQWKTKVICLWGETGTGKSYTAFQAGAESVSYDGKFYLNYKNQETIVFDDFDPCYMRREEFLKITDEYPYTVNIKGGDREWNPRTIYITSNYDPSRWYGGDKAVLRRLDEIRHLTKVPNFLQNTAKVTASQLEQ